MLVKKVKVDGQNVNKKLRETKGRTKFKIE